MIDSPVPAATVATMPDSATPRASPWWRIADSGVFGLWIAVVAFTLHHHEKWCDEAQAWLFARDLSLRRLWFYELRYEGSPGLWHTILWIAQHVFHAKYNVLGYIGMAGATAGVALLIFKAPFPRYIRYPLAFTYFMVYQYAVIARQYTLLPFLTFAAVLLLKGIGRPLRLTAILMLLALVSFHGTLLAAGLGLAYLCAAVPHWRNLDKRVQNRYVISIALMVLTFVFVFIVLKPANDSLEMDRKPGLFQPPTFTNAQGQFITSSVKFKAILSGGLLDSPVPSAAFLILAGAWCFTRHRPLVFTISVFLMVALYSLVYGYAHHQGTLFIAAIAGIWFAWPSEGEQRTFPVRDRRLLQGMTVLLLGLCAVNIWDSAVVIKRDYLYPYSGAEDAANYLMAVGADRGPIFGYGFGISGVQAYFDHNILANIPTSYTHNGQPGWHNMDVEQAREVRPEYIVVFSVDPDILMRFDGPTLTSLGYKLVHFSDGYYFYKQGVYEREVYLIFRHVHASSG
jgi:hypothetical protein